MLKTKPKIQATKLSPKLRMTCRPGDRYLSPGFWYSSPGLMESVVLKMYFDGAWETLEDGHMKRCKRVTRVAQPPTPCMAIWLGDGEKPPGLPKLNMTKF
ncbi:hypothetical protein WN944_004775 [Citrus x changshan-huyou]|uniref:Uncharacterized protein n=1 Tax=Citrus x changshan-huyou TaxID=2935761 RepID=A0AAP0M153_9ROSI